MRRSIFYRVYPVYLVTAVVALTTLSFAATRVFREALYDEKQLELRTIATLAINALAAEPAQKSLDRFRDGIDERLTIIALDGTVVAESHGDQATMDNHAERPEVRAALDGTSGMSVRLSSTTGENTLYLALSFQTEDGDPAGVVRVATSVERLDRRTREMLAVLIAATLLIVLATGVTTGLILDRVQRPLRAIRDAAQRYTAGDLTHRITVAGPEEMVGVADTLNAMAERLAETIGRISDQRNELEAVLTSMVEGVIVVNSDRRIRSMNPASQRLFGKEGTEHAGRSLIEYLRNSDLDGFVGEVLESGAYAERTITLYRPGPVFIQVHCTLLRREDDRTRSVLLVLNDITRMKRLEAVRRDFVANVSHELKTPVTAILGFVETLREGTPEEPERAARFLEIISTHANRLNLIIEDLLTLSRLESTEDSIEIGECSPDLVVNRIVETLGEQAAQRGIQLRVLFETENGQRGERLAARGSESLLEQAVGNLVNNAIKYSAEGGIVEIFVRNGRADLVIEVKDTGQGIPAGDLPRVFERFYRVDRARSRELGGTGLGLAIVKHIALAHRGEVTVESAEGVGSTFTLRLPQEDGVRA